MWLFWAVAVTLLVIGGVLCAKFKEIHPIEWAASAGVALLMAGIFQAIAFVGATSDDEVWSGRITAVTYRPAWLEYYEYAVYRNLHPYDEVSSTDSKGNTTTTQVPCSHEVFDHWEPSQRQHPDVWMKYDDLEQSWAISPTEFADFVQKFGRKASLPGTRHTSDHASRMIAGDPNDYAAENVNRYVSPTTTHKSWTNRIKASPSLFSFPRPPKGVEIYPYPKTGSPFVSDRLVGTARNAVSPLEWDQLNSRLGYSKKVNLILAGFKGGPELANYQQAAWVGGKKNDLVLCYGGDPQHPTWAKVFGWSDSNYCKHQLETILLKGFGPDTLEAIESEVRKNYTIKKWSDFDHIRIDPPTWSYWAYFGTVIAVQLAIWWYAYVNELSKNPVVERLQRLQRSVYDWPQSKFRR